MNGIHDERENFVLDTSFYWEETNERDNSQRQNWFFLRFFCLLFLVIAIWMLLNCNHWIDLLHRAYGIKITPTFIKKYIFFVIAVLKTSVSFFVGKVSHENYLQAYMIIILCFELWNCEDKRQKMLWKHSKEE